MATLERTKLHHVEDVVLESRKQLIAKAEHTFGYSGRARAGSSLRQALIALGIDPLDPVKVRDYKRSKAYNKRLYSDGENAAGIIALGGVLSVLISIHQLRSLPSAVQAPDRLWVILGVGAVAMVVGALARFMTDRVRWKRGQWVASSVTNYGFDKIPDFALARAIEVRNACPEATLAVEFLHEERGETVIRDTDPFIRATLGGETYYLDVWDELEFERTI